MKPTCPWKTILAAFLAVLFLTACAAENGVISGEISAPSAEESSAVSEEKPDENVFTPEINLSEVHYFRADSVQNPAVQARTAAGTKPEGKTVPLEVMDSRRTLQDYVETNRKFYNFEALNSEGLSVVTAAAAYSDSFFAAKKLAILHISSGTGSARYRVTDVRSEDGSTEILVSVSAPEIGTADLAEWFIFVPVAAEHAQSVQAKLCPENDLR